MLHIKDPQELFLNQLHTINDCFLHKHIVDQKLASVLVISIKRLNEFSCHFSSKIFILNSTVTFLFMTRNKVVFEVKISSFKLAQQCMSTLQVSEH